jgi:hypothetical protein
MGARLDAFFDNFIAEDFYPGPVSAGRMKDAGRRIVQAIFSEVGSTGCPAKFLPFCHW